MQVTIDSPEEMELFAACCARYISTGSFLYLCGELGAGKTTFVRGVLRALDYRGIVKSPTYTLVESYDVAPCRIYHFDLYRITTPTELDDIGCRDYFDGRGACLVEWPERGAECLPSPDLTIKIRLDRNRRDVHCQAHSGSWEKHLGKIRTEFSLKTKKNSQIA